MKIEITIPIKSKLCDSIMLCRMNHWYEDKSPNREKRSKQWNKYNVALNDVFILRHPPEEPKPLRITVF